MKLDYLAEKICIFLGGLKNRFAVYILLYPAPSETGSFTAFLAGKMKSVQQGTFSACTIL